MERKTQIEIYRTLGLMESLAARVRDLMANDPGCEPVEDIDSILDSIVSTEEPVCPAEASGSQEGTTTLEEEENADSGDPGGSDEGLLTIWELWDELNPDSPRPKIGSPEYISLQKIWSQGRPGEHPRAKGKTVALPKGVTVAAIQRVLEGHKEGMTAREMAFVCGVTPQSINYNCRRNMYPWLVVVVETRDRARVWSLAKYHPKLAQAQRKNRDLELCRGVN